MKSLSIRIPDDIASRLQDLANLTGCAKSQIALEAISWHLDEMEDIYVSECRLEELRSRRVQPLSLDDLIESHGVDA